MAKHADGLFHLTLNDVERAVLMNLIEDIRPRQRSADQNAILTRLTWGCPTPESKNSRPGRTHE